MQNKQKPQNRVVRRFCSMSVSHLLMQIIHMGILFYAESDSDALGFGLRFCITTKCLREADIAGPQTTRWVTRHTIMPPKQLFIFVYAAAAAAKSLQLCPTLCDPIDGSPPGSPVPGILQARTVEWVATSFSNAWKVKSESEPSKSYQSSQPIGKCVLSLSHSYNFFL